MTGRIASRTAIFLLTAWAGSVAIFALLAVVPGDPAAVALGINSTPEALSVKRAEFGTDRPLLVQYAEWVTGLLRGDFGTSYLSGLPVGDQIAQRAQVSVWLVGLSILVAVLIAFPLGVAAAVLRTSRWGPALSALTQAGVAIPTFIAAILLINIFSVRMGWLPSGGWVTPMPDPVAFAQQVALPVLSLGVAQAALLSRYVRSATLGVLREDHIRTARAIGLSPAQAFLRHGARNAAIPVVTVLGLQLAALLVETIVIERVFVIPGLGSLLLDAVSSRDLLLVQGIVLVLVVTILLLNFVVDALYSVLDPRLRRS